MKKRKARENETKFAGDHQHGAVISTAPCLEAESKMDPR